MAFFSVVNTNFQNHEYSVVLDGFVLQLDKKKKSKKKKKGKKCCKNYKKKEGKMCKDCPKLKDLAQRIGIS
jgi:hypothetical protein